MNKKELIKHVADKTGVTRAQATAAVEAVVDAIESSLKAGDTVTLTGFGSFTVAERAARVARNPRTGETINIPASRAPKFRASKHLKEIVA